MKQRTLIREHDRNALGQGSRAHALLLFVITTLASCVSTPLADRPITARLDSAAVSLAEAAQSAATLAARRRGTRQEAAYWIKCAVASYQVMQVPTSEMSAQAAALSTYCTEQFLRIVLHDEARHWRPGLTELDGVELQVVFRELSHHMVGPLALTRASDVSMQIFGNKRYSSAGFGVPLSLVAARCQDRPACELFPPEGVFRWGTAWIEADSSGTNAIPRLVIADPAAVAAIRIGSQRYTLAMDTSAFYARGVRTTHLRRLGIWGLLGGNEVGKRAGVYLLEEYDPRKQPVVMIHGLGSSPLAWAKLSNAIWGTPELRARFQVWHVVYQTNAPLLITRRRIQGYLDEAWGLLDPEGDDPARDGMVLIGHSMGGVLSRLLCVDSGDILWDTAFTTPSDALRGESTDLDVVRGTFKFQHYPGVTQGIFLAAPHRGSPSADAWFGRFMRKLVGRRAPEMQSLKRITRQNSMAIREELRETYLQARLNSISTLQTSQPVARAAEALMPVAGVKYHVISGVIQGKDPPTDGAVPLASTLLPGATSTLQVRSGHNIYENEEAIQEVIRLLQAPRTPAL